LFSSLHICRDIYVGGHTRLDAWMHASVYCLVTPNPLLLLYLMGNKQQRLFSTTNSYSYDGPTVAATACRPLRTILCSASFVC
jgi:hypothetical protein